MTQFFEDASINPMLMRGIYAGLLAAVACGVIGPYVVTRRFVFLAGAIAHTAVGGIGFAIWLRHQAPDSFEWFTPLHGATLAALLGALVVGIVQDRARERLDTLIGAIWAIGMSVGILLLKYTPGYHTELTSYLFGNIVSVPVEQIRLVIVLDVLIVGVVLVMHKRLLAVCLDEEQARLQGVPVLATNLILLALVALAVVCLIQVVGLILVLALLTLPAATAGHIVHRLGAVMFVSTLLCAALTTLPRIGVYGTRISPESAIVLSAAVVYGLVLAGRWALRRR